MKNNVIYPPGQVKSDSSMLTDLTTTQINWPYFPSTLAEEMYEFYHDGFIYDFIYHPSEEKRLFVLLNGAFDRKRYHLPVFQRWSWAKAFPGHCLYISDPSLYLDDELSLAWYIGNKEKEVLPTISELIKKVAATLDISLKDVIFYGSSGGGYAALQLSALLPEATAVVINPQIDISKYHYQKSVQLYLDKCFDGISPQEAVAAYPDRFNIIPLSEQISDNKVLYLQNTMDTHHYEVHFQLFADAFGLNEGNKYTYNKMEAFFFEHPDGHKKAELKESFPEIMELAINLTEK